jgi:hypothetical protein
MRSALFWDVTLRNIPEERRSHLHRGGSLKSQTLLWSETKLTEWKCCTLHHNTCYKTKCLTETCPVKSTGKIGIFIAFISLFLGLNDFTVLILFGIFRISKYVSDKKPSGEHVLHCTISSYKRHFVASIFVSRGAIVQHKVKTHLHKGNHVGGNGKIGAK